MDINSTNSEFLLERYKYTLNQKAFLNDSNLKIAAVYQTILAAVLAGQFIILEKNQSGSISGDIAWAGSWALFALLCLASVIFLSLVVCGVASWFSYRNEEVEIADAMKIAVAARPTARNWYRWYESYFILAAIVAIGTYLYFVTSIVPSLLMFAHTSISR